MAIHTDQPWMITTIEKHILDAQRDHPEATGTLTQLLYDIALAGKVISSKTTRAGLAEILGGTEEVNIQGELVQKLDTLADRTIFRLNDHTGRLAVMASEEHAGLLNIPEHYSTAKYVYFADPLDGSSDHRFQHSVGTIFPSTTEPGRPRHFGRLHLARSGWSRQDTLSM
jgi:fructose-1,6-bisphosphatase I